jgi:6-phosphogluconolactonase (cycloisomerase 2 family)
MTAMKKTFGVAAACLLALLAGCSSGQGNSAGVGPSHYLFGTVPTQNAIDAMRMDSHSGALTNVVGGPFPAGMSPTSIVVHPSGKFAYVANQAGNDISLLTIDNSTGALTEVMPRTPAGVTPVYLTMDVGGDFLFAANQSSNNVSVYSINSGSGALTEVSGSPFPANPSPIALSLAPSGNFLFAANANAAAVTVFSVSAGVLQQVPGSPFPAGNGPFSLAVDPSGSFLYVANSLDGTFSAMSVDSTGFLTPISGSPFSAIPTTGNTANTDSDSTSVVFGTNIHRLYIANQGTNNVSVFAIDSSSGIPTALTDSPFAAGTAPTILAVDSTGNFLLVSNESKKTLSILTINGTSGGLGAGVSNTVTLSYPITSIATTK